MTRGRNSLAGNLLGPSFRWYPIWMVSVATLLGIAAALLPLSAAAGLYMGLTIFLVTLIQPLAGLAFALIAGPLGATENLFLGSSFPESGQILFLLVVAAWLGRGVLRRQIVIPHSSLNRPLAIFIAVASVSLLIARSPSLAIKEVVKWIEIGFAMLLVFNLAGSASSPPASERSLVDRSPRTALPIRWLLALLVIVGLSQAILGIWQFGLRGQGPDHFMILDRFYRAFGTFNQPNPFGGLMAVSANLALGAFLGLAMGQIRNIRQKARAPRSQLVWILFFAVGALLSVLALIMSWSRGAWLGFGVAMAVMTLFLPRRRWHGLLLLASVALLFLLLVGLGLVPMSITERLGDFRQDLQLGDIRGADIENGNFAVLERLAHWQAGVEMVRFNLWQGVGFGNYGPAYPDYALANWPNALGHAHNYYLNVLAETGIFGLVAYLAFWTAVFAQTLVLLRRLDWPRRGYALGLLAAWTTISVHHVVDKLYVNNLYIYFGVMLGVQLILAKEND